MLIRATPSIAGAKRAPRRDADAYLAPSHDGHELYIMTPSTSLVDLMKKGNRGPWWL